MFLYNMNLREIIVFYLYSSRTLRSFKKSCRSVGTTIYYKSSRELENHEAIPSCKLAYPRLLPLLIWYERFSTAIMIYALAKSVLPLDSLIESLFEPSIPGHCFLPGRLIVLYLPFELSKKVAMALAGLHLFTRFLEHDRVIPESFNLVMFMLAQDDDVKRLQTTLKRTNKVSSSAHLEYLRKTICYHVDYGTHIEYRIRANRTLEAKFELEKKVFADSSLGLILIIITQLIIIPPSVIFGFSDIGYANNYPGCNPTLDKLYLEDKLTFFTLTITKHKLLTIPFDLLENVTLVWIDTITGASFIPAAALILNSDLILCWSSMHIRLKKAVVKLKLFWIESNVMTDEKTAKTGESLPKTSLSVSRQDCENMINEIQCELCDCFNQIKDTDAVMSDIITIPAVFWLITCTMLSYYLPSIVTSRTLQYVQLYVFIGFSAIGFYLMVLYCFTYKSYGLICSLMAYDKSKYKRTFIKILEFYQERNHSSYTLFRTIPFIPATYLTFMGYTFSSLTIVRNLVDKGL